MTYLRTTLLLTLTTLLGLGDTFIPAFRVCTSPQYTTANTAVFDGSAGDGLYTEPNTLTAMGDSKAFTLSFWLNPTASGSVYQIINGSRSGLGALRFLVTKHTDETISVTGWNSGGSSILAFFSELTVSIGVWNHVYIAIDLANSANRHVYINGVDDTTITWTTYTDDTIQFNVAGGGSPSYWIGLAANGTSEGLVGALAELWFNDAYLNDVSKFYCSGRPVDVGADGSTPTGSAPALYLSRNGSGNNWRVDSSGNGNTFTVNGGTLGTTTSP